MPRAVHFGATSSLKRPTDLRLAATGTPASLALTTQPKLSTASDDFLAPVVQVSPTLLTTSPSRKRLFQDAFGAAGVRASQAPRPGPGSMPATEWV